jgi:hypothetical protein
LNKQKVRHLLRYTQEYSERWRGQQHHAQTGMYLSGGNRGLAKFEYQTNEPNLWLLDIIRNMGLVTTFLDKRCPPRSQLQVLNPTILSLKFEVRVDSSALRSGPVQFFGIFFKLLGPELVHSYQLKS